MTKDRTCDSSMTHGSKDKEEAYKSDSSFGLSIKHHKAKKRRIEPADQEDRISALPDPLIHHIFSFFPSTKQTVKTCILSKRWRYLWTGTPNLIWAPPSWSVSAKRLASSINKTLTRYDSSKCIKKFCIDCSFNTAYDTHEFKALKALPLQINSWLHFSTARHAEEVILNIVFDCEDDWYLLPQVLYNNVFLVRLTTDGCRFASVMKVHWVSLKVLNITNAYLSHKVINHILAGCPVLESLELRRCRGFVRLNIASRRLKRLCLYATSDYLEDLEIWGPYIEDLKILGNWYIKKWCLMNMLSLFSATFDFELYLCDEDYEDFYEDKHNFVKKILQMVRHAKELKLGNWCLKILSILELKGLPSPLSNIKCLTVETDGSTQDFRGVASLLRSSIELEKLVLKFCDNMEFDFDPEIYNSLAVEENYWTSHNMIFGCLSLHLHIVEIFGFNLCEHLLAFVEFLLKNGRVLKKIVIYSNGKGGVHSIAGKLLSLPRSSPCAVVRFL